MTQVVALVVTGKHNKKKNFEVVKEKKKKRKKEKDLLVDRSPLKKILKRGR